MSSFEGPGTRLDVKKVERSSASMTIAVATWMMIVLSGILFILGVLYAR